GGHVKDIRRGIACILYATMGIRPASHAQVIDAFDVDRKKAHRGTVFRSHVGDSRSVHDGQGGGAGPIEFHEFPNYFGLAQHLSNSKGKISGSDTFSQGAFEMDADDIRGQEINWLAKHASFSFYSADAPAHNAKAVDHRGVRVGSHQRVRIYRGHAVRLLVTRENSLGQVLEIDLVNDANARWHDLESLKSLHSPLEKLITLTIASKLHL